MKHLITVIALLFSGYLPAQTILYQTNFSAINDLSGTGLYTSELAQSDDYKEWMTANTYCVFENTGNLILPSINIPKGSRITITWGIHDSGRNIELQADNIAITTFTTSTMDKLVQTSYDFSSSFFGDKILTLSIPEGNVFITEILITSDNPLNVNKSKIGSLNAWMEGKNMIISSTETEKMEIVSSTGQKMYQGSVMAGQTILPIILNNGIYFVRVGKNAVKVWVNNR